MRCKYWAPLWLVVLTVVLGPLAAAQEKSNKQKPLPSYYRIVQYVVPPGKADEFRAVARQVVEQLAEQESTARFTCLQSQEVVFTFILPLDSIGDRSRQAGALIEAGRALGDEWAAQAADTIDYMNEFLVVARRDLAYDPDEPRLSPAETQFIHFDFHYIDFGKDGQAEATAKEFADLHKKTNCDTGFMVYEVVGGEELPILIVSTGAKDIVDFYANEQRVLKALGPQVGAIADERDSVVRRIERIDSTVVPELSYQPVEHGD